MRSNTHNPYAPVLPWQVQAHAQRLNEENTALQTRVQYLNTVNVALQTQVQRQKEANGALQTQCQELEGKCVMLEAELGHACNNLQQARDLNVRNQSELVLQRETNAGLTGELHRERETNVALTGELHRERETNQEYQKQLYKLNEENKKRNNQASSTQQQKNELETLHRDIEQLKTQLKNLHTANNQKQIELELLCKKNDELQKQLEHERDNAKRLENTIHDITEAFERKFLAQNTKAEETEKRLREKITELKNENNLLKTQIEQLTQSKTDMKKNNARDSKLIESLKSEIEVLRKEVQQRIEQIKLQEEKIASLSQTAENGSREIKKLRELARKAVEGVLKAEDRRGPEIDLIEALFHSEMRAVVTRQLPITQNISLAVKRLAILDNLVRACKAYYLENIARFQNETACMAKEEWILSSRATTNTPSAIEAKKEFLAFSGIYKSMCGYFLSIADDTNATTFSPHKKYFACFMLCMMPLLTRSQPPPKTPYLCIGPEGLIILNAITDIRLDEFGRYSTPTAEGESVTVGRQFSVLYAGLNEERDGTLLRKIAALHLGIMAYFSHHRDIADNVKAMMSKLANIYLPQLFWLTLFQLDPEKFYRFCYAVEDLLTNLDLSGDRETLDTAVSDLKIACNRAVSLSKKTVSGPYLRVGLFKPASDIAAIGTEDQEALAVDRSHIQNSATASGAAASS